MNNRQPNITANSFRVDDSDTFASGNFSAKHLRQHPQNPGDRTEDDIEEPVGSHHIAPVTISGGFNKGFASEYNESTPLGVSINTGGRESLLSMSLSKSARIKNHIHNTSSNALNVMGNNNNNYNTFAKSAPVSSNVSMHQAAQSPSLNPVISVGSASQIGSPILDTTDIDVQSIDHEQFPLGTGYNHSGLTKRNLLGVMSFYDRFAGEDLRELDDRSEFNETDDGRGDDKKTSTSEAFLLLLKAFLGTGIIFLPKAMSNGGLLFSNIMILSFSIISYFCFVMLTKTTSKFNVSGYGDIGYQIFGKGMQFVILLSLALSQLGFASTYVVFVSENFQQISHLLKKDYTLGLFILLQCIIFTPISLTRNISTLGFFALIADVFIFSGILYIYSQSTGNLFLNGVNEKIEMFKPESWTLFIGTAVFTYEGIGLLIPIQESMREPEKFNSLLIYVMVIVTIVFTSIASISYLSFGDNIHTIILMDFPQNEITVLVQILYCTAILLSTPIQLFPAIKIIENYLFSKHRNTWKNKIRRNSEAISIISNPSQNYDVSSIRRASRAANFNLINEDGLVSGKSDIFIKTMKNVLRVVVVFIMCLVAYFGSSQLDKFVSIIGSITCVPLIYIYPPLLYLHGFADEISSSTKYLCWFTCFCGSVLMIYTSFETVSGW